MHSCGFSFYPHATDCNEIRSRFTSLCNETISRSISRLPFLHKKRHRLSLTGPFYLFRLSLWNSLFLLSFFSNVVPAWLMSSSHLSETVTVLSLRQSLNIL